MATTIRKYKNAATTAASMAMTTSQKERASTAAEITSNLAQNPAVKGMPACDSSSTG